MKTCPQITHELKVSFNSMAKFNEHFAKLAKMKPDRKDREILDINFEDEMISLEPKEE
ncbi:22253_t:CDS:1, partial [Gigaspora rosea]